MVTDRIRRQKVKRWLLTAVKLILLLLVVSLAAYLLVLNSPNDPVESYVGRGITPEERQIIEANWGLDRSPAERYFLWLKNVLHGEFGQSIVYGQPVKTVLASRVSATLALLLTAWLISGIFGFLLGVLAGMNRGTWADKLIKQISLLFASSPLFWIGLLFIMLFSVKLGWLPMGLSAPAGKLAQDVTLWDRLYHLILPSITLGLTGMSKIVLHTREKMIDILDSDYMLFARARGESRWQAVRRHGIRNILLPAITLQFNSINELFSGSVLAEQVFSYPGLGNAATTAGLHGDANLLLAVTLFSAVLIFVGNLTAEFLYGVLDPQIREERKYAG